MQKNEYNFREWQRIYRYGSVCKCILPPEIFHTVKQTNLVTMAISREKNRRVKTRRERSLNHPLIYFLNVCLAQVLLIIQEINFPKRILNVLERGKISGMKNKLF